MNARSGDAFDSELLQQIAADGIRFVEIAVISKAEPKFVDRRGRDGMIPREYAALPVPQLTYVQRINIGVSERQPAPAEPTEDNVVTADVVIDPGVEVIVAGEAGRAGILCLPVAGLRAGSAPVRRREKIC